MDLVSGRGVLFGRPRKEVCADNDPTCCPAGDICFRRGDFPALDTAGKAMSTNALVKELAGKLLDRTYPTDALVRWVAPFTGRLDLKGVFRKLRVAPAGGDGVELQIFTTKADGSPYLLGSFSSGPGDTSSKDFEYRELYVLGGDTFYFKTSNREDVPTRREADVTVGLDEVALEPVFQYTHVCSGYKQSCVELGATLAGTRDPSGHSYARYALKDDLRVAGAPVMGVRVPVEAQITVGGTFTKTPTADDVTACIQEFSSDAAVSDRPCAATDLLVHTFTWHSSETMALTVDRRVSAGASLVFRVESDTPVDPAAFTWRPAVNYTGLCVPGGACQVPTQAEADRLRRPVDPHIAIHTPSFDGPPRFFVAPVGGTFHLVSTLAAVEGMGPPTVGVVVHRGSERLMKATGTHDRSVEVQLNQGDVLVARAYGGLHDRFTWDLRLQTPDAPEGTGIYDVARNVALQLPQQPFAGGYRGFAVGEWNGKEAFDARRIVPFKPEEWENLSEKQVRELIKDKLGDPESAEAKSLRLFAPLLPRQGQTELASGPAWVSSDGATFVAPGRAHGGRKAIQLPREAAEDDRTAQALDGVVRSSVNQAKGANLGLSTPVFGLGVSGSVGPTVGIMETVDLNGDGLLDTVVGADVRLTRPSDRTSMAPFSLGGPIRRAEGISLVFSPSSGGLPAKQEGSRGQARAVTAGDVVSAVAGLAVGNHALGVSRDEVEADLVDINGDGLPDRVERVAGKTTFKVWMNLGTSFAEAADELPTEAWSTQVDNFFFNGVQKTVRDLINQTTGATWPEVLRTSALRHTTAMTLMSNWGASFGIGSGATAGIAYQGSVARTSVDLLDVNGDGLPDLVKKGAFDSGLWVQLNLGYGFAPQEEWSMPSWGQVPQPKLRFVIDNRNLTDPLLSLGIGTNGDVDGLAMTASYSDPNSWSASAGAGFDISWLCPFCPAVVVEKTVSESSSRSGFDITLQDIDGDGAADHVLKNTDTPDVTWARMGNISNARSGLLKKVVRPLGGSFELSYARAGNTVAMPHARWVLDRVAVHDGRSPAGAQSAVGHDFWTRYTYEGGYYDRVEKEFYGFSRVVRQMGDGKSGGDGRLAEQLFHNDRYALRGSLREERTFDRAGRLYSRVVNAYKTTTLEGQEEGCVTTLPHPLSTMGAACEIVFPQLEDVTTSACEGGDACVAVSEHFQYDATHGGVVLFEDRGEAGDGDDVIARVLYPPASSPQGQRHIFATPTDIMVTDRAGNLLRKRHGEYYDNGNLKVLTQQIDEKRVADSRFTWTPEGNLLRVEGPLNHRDQRYYVEYDYEDDAETYVRSAKDAFGLTSSAVHDLRFGGPKVTVDASGNSTSQAFDAFGRVTDVYSPYDLPGDAATVHFIYHPEAKPAFAITEHKLPPPISGKATLDTVVFVDGMRRTLQTKKDAAVEGEGAGYAVSGGVVYDLAGRAWKEGQPTFSTADRSKFVVRDALVQPTLVEYDVLDRKRRIVAPDASETLIDIGIAAMPGEEKLRVRTVLTDAHGHERVSYADVPGRTVAVEERLVEESGARSLFTRYAYSALGELKTIQDAAGNVSSFGYDLVGQRNRIDTKDSGLLETVRDPAGNVVEQWNPRLRAAGEPIRFVYEFNRLRTIDYPQSADVAFTYGLPGRRPENDAGRVREIEDEVGKEVRGYGRLGELAETTRVMRPLRPGDKPLRFTTRFDTDALGRALSITYPDGEVVRYGYDAGGQLNSVVGTRPATARQAEERETYISDLRYDVFGNRTYAVFGNGVSSRYTYDPKTLRLDHLTTKTPQGRTLQEINYQFDKGGLLKEMTNALGSATAEHSGTVSHEFQYDSLERLAWASGSALSRPGVKDTFTSTFAFTDVHDLKRKTQVRELVTGGLAGPVIERPDSSNHDETYVYEGRGPHQATLIGETRLEYDLNGNTLAECRSPQGTGCDVDGAGGGDASRTHLRRYVWTEDNRLAASIDGGGRNATLFLYDGGGERVVKLGQGAPSITVGQFFSLKGRYHATKHVFAGGTRVASKVLPLQRERVTSDGEDAPGLEESVNGCEPSGDQPSKCPVPVTTPAYSEAAGAVRPATFYFHPDFVGSTSWITDRAGQVYEHLEYFPFGDSWREERGDSTPRQQLDQYFRYTGKPYDEETGLTYFGARYYDSRKARWLSVDNLARLLNEGAVKNPDELSVYSYGRNNPLGFVDPDGEQSIIVVGPRLGGSSGDPEKYAPITRSMTFKWAGVTRTTVVTVDFDDPRKMPGFDFAARAYFKGFGYGDISNTTPVVRSEEFRASNPAVRQLRPGDNVYMLIHGETRRKPLDDPDNTASGVVMGGKTGVWKAEGILAFANEKEVNLVIQACFGGRMYTDDGTYVPATGPRIGIEFNFEDFVLTGAMAAKAWDKGGEKRATDRRLTVGPSGVGSVKIRVDYLKAKQPEPVPSQPER